MSDSTVAAAAREYVRHMDRFTAAFEGGSSEELDAVLDDGTEVYKRLRTAVDAEGQEGEGPQRR